MSTQKLAGRSQKEDGGRYSLDLDLDGSRQPVLERNAGMRCGVYGQFHSHFAVAYFIGSAEEGWVKQRFPKAKFLGVANSGATAPLEDIMSKRADAAPINRIPYVPMARKVKGLASLPKENNCQDSTEKAQPVGMAIDKKQPEFLEWARAVEKSIHPQLVASEQKVIDTMK